MEPITVMVISPETTIKAFLKSQLPDGEFEVLDCEPGVDEMMALVPQVQIAVVDRINERPEIAQLEISLLKKNRPKLPIIAISEHSSTRDASVVQQGVFYYLAGYSEQKLLRVIRAAAGVVPENESQS